MDQKNPDVLLILGSESDAETVVDSGMLELFESAGVVCRQSIISAHRHPEILADELLKVQSMDVRVIIGVGGMALALPGFIAAKTRDRCVVLGVALASPERPDALDATESIIRLPVGTAVGYCGIGKAGLVNAAILACQVLAVAGNLQVCKGLAAWRKRQRDSKPPQTNIDLEKIVKAARRGAKKR